MLGEQFEAFVQATPVAVMMSETLEPTFAPERREAVSEAHATTGYTQQLAFAACVRLMGDVVFGAARSVSAYLEAHLTRLGVSRAAVYAKLNRLEPAVGAGLVAHTAHDLRAVLEAMPQAPAPILAGWRVRAERRRRFKVSVPVVQLGVLPQRTERLTLVKIAPGTPGNGVDVGHA